MGKRFWLCSGMTLVSSGVSAFYSVAGLEASPHDSFAQYAASRSVSLLLLVLLSVILRKRAFVLAFAWCMTSVQLLDGWIGFLAHNPFETYGPIAFAIVNAILAVSLWKEAPRKETRSA